MLKKKALRIFAGFTVLAVMAVSFAIPGTPAYAANPPVEIKDNTESSDFAMQAIRNMAQKGIISGDENGNFYPHADITRAEAAKILVLSLGLDTQTAPDTPTFQDVSKSDWAYAYVEAAYRAGIVNGITPGLFDPDGKCTREQLAKMFVNSMELSDGAFNIDDASNSGLVSIKDYDKISDWAKDAVRVAVYSGIMLGDGSAFLPDQNATKEQMAVVADRFTEKRTQIQQELDAIANTQVTGQSNGFVFIFSEPVEHFGIQKITDQTGTTLRGTNFVGYDSSETYRKSTYWEGEYVRVTDSYYPPYDPASRNKKDNLVPGKTYKVKFSFNYKYGDTKTTYFEKDVTILPNSAHVEAVIPVNATQIRVKFSDWVTVASADDPKNYLLRDQNGEDIPIKSVTDSGLKDETKYVFLNLARPVAERARITAQVNGSLQRFSDLKPVLSYSCTVVMNDQEAPDIEQVQWDNDGTYFTSATLYFSEPVASGTVMIDNEPAGPASGEVTTISGLKLDGSKSHQINVTDISDGVNTDKSSTLTGIARLYDPPKTDTIPPKVEKVDFTKDASGRVDTITLTYTEDLLPSVPANGGITAADENGNPVYAEQTIIDENGNPVLDKNGQPLPKIKIFCNSNGIPVDKKVTITIATGVNIYGGRYTISLPPQLVVDMQYNDSEPETITVDF